MKLSQESLDLLERLDQWQLTTQPHIEDPGTSIPSADLYQLTADIVCWCDKHTLDAGILWEVYRQIIACRKPDRYGWIGPRQPADKMRDTYRKAVDVILRVKSIAINKISEDKKQLSKADIRKQYSPEDRALIVLRKHPDWTVTQIAREADVNRASLYRMQTFMDARTILEQSKRDFPRGFKNQETGELEAWEDN